MERELVELAQHGDEEAFASLMRMAGDRLMAVAFRILRDVDRAEDAVQQTIVAAWQDLPTLRDPDRFAGWLYRILVHACYAELRRDQGNSRAPCEAVPRTESTWLSSPPSPSAIGGRRPRPSPSGRER